MQKKQPITKVTMGKDTNGRRLSPQEEAKLDLLNMERAADEVQKYCQKHGVSVVVTSERHTICTGNVTISPAGKKR